MFKDLEKYFYYSYTETVNGLRTINIVSPGKKKEDFEIALAENILTVKVGGYSDYFKLTSAVDQNLIEADYEAGILIIKLPKKESEKPRSISIN